MKVTKKQYKEGMQYAIYADFKERQILIESMELALESTVIKAKESTLAHMMYELLNPEP